MRELLQKKLQWSKGTESDHAKLQSSSLTERAMSANLILETRKVHTWMDQILQCKLLLCKKRKLVKRSREKWLNLFSFHGSTSAGLSDWLTWWTSVHWFLFLLPFIGEEAQEKRTDKKNNPSAEHSYGMKVNSVCKRVLSKQLSPAAAIAYMVTGAMAGIVKKYSHSIMKSTLWSLSFLGWCNNSEVWDLSRYCARSFETCTFSFTTPVSHLTQKRKTVLCSNNFASLSTQNTVDSRAKGKRKRNKNPFTSGKCRSMCMAGPMVVLFM